MPHGLASSTIGHPDLLILVQLQHAFQNGDENTEQRRDGAKGDRQIGLASDKCKADKNGIRAAAMISITLIHLYFFWHLELLRVVPVDLVFEAGDDRVAGVVSGGRRAHGCPLYGFAGATQAKFVSDRHYAIYSGRVSHAAM